ncbi:exodeoxyribonuclease V, alpha subunit [Idiomarina sp. A28L]|uniref:exodeoxyribonuclease V subunit alpha n=1 Tax=Idiomarina sp. A28L TaxID=1036674 RepID=UPI0002138C24|nr:exodeoxyribonuclease V subunit alpha [Idiomarina sp. A28L]EGN75422.1 exodeoxyribonuclease V, alpha subunit [Idiomarina sp. A28L]
MITTGIVQEWFSKALAQRELRPIDIELPQVLHKLAPETNPLGWLLCTLVSHQYGRGHSCMRLSELIQTPEYVLGFALPSEFKAALVESDLHQVLQNSAWVQCLAHADETVTQPLVYFAGALYLARLWKAEHSVAHAIETRIATSNAENSVDSDLPALLKQVFGEPNTATIDWQALACAMAAQRKFAIITGGPGTGKTTTVVRLLAILRQKHGDNLRILLAAPTGKAAARLTESISGAIIRLPEAMQAGIPTEVTTLHKMLGARPFRRSFKHSATQPLAADVVVVDEASMVDLEMMAALMNALPENAQLVLLGDKDQLASVEAGSVLGDLCKGAEAGNYSVETLAMLQAYTHHDLSAFAAVPSSDSSASAYNQATVMLRESHRFGADSGIGNLARAVNAGEIHRTLPSASASENGKAYTTESIFAAFNDLNLLTPQQHEKIHPTEFTELRKLVVQGYKTYLQLVAKGEASADLELGAEATPKLSARDKWAKEVLDTHRSFQVLVALRKGVWGVQGLNDIVTEWLQSAGFIARASLGAKTWYAGRPVLVQRNNYTLNLMNGDIGITLPDPETGKLRVVFEQADGSIKWVLPSRLSDVETVFALTVHKSQGSEFAHTVLVLPDEINPVLTRELVYTGITRASKVFTLVAAKASVFVDAVQQRVIRSSGL